MTKYIKNLTVVLLAALAMTSCGTFGKGTVGDTTVYFSREVVEDGFSAGFVYVPIRMDIGNEANTADVNVTVVCRNMKICGKYKHKCHQDT